MDNLDRVEKFIDWKRFQNLASELISPRLQTGSGEESDKAARNFTAFIASAYRLWKSTQSSRPKYRQLKHKG
jgi:hypothetical protein